MTPACDPKQQGFIIFAGFNNPWSNQYLVTPNLAREPPSAGRGLGEAFASEETMRKQGDAKIPESGQKATRGTRAHFHGFSRFS